MIHHDTGHRVGLLEAGHDTGRAWWEDVVHQERRSERLGAPLLAYSRHTARSDVRCGVQFAPSGNRRRASLGCSDVRDHAELLGPVGRALTRGSTPPAD